MSCYKIIFGVVLAALLFGCDGSKPKDKAWDELISHASPQSKDKLEQLKAQSTPDKIEEFKNRSLYDDAAQGKQRIVNKIKAMLPVMVDEVTMLVDVFVDNNTIGYKYEIKGTPKEVFLLPETEKDLHDILIKNYCQDIPELKMLRLLFPEGARYIYFFGGEEAFSIDVAVSDCNTKE
jgi:hypothetical protein